MSHKTRVVPVNLPHVTYTKAFMYSSVLTFRYLKYMWPNNDLLCLKLNTLTFAFHISIVMICHKFKILYNRKSYSCFLEFGDVKIFSAKSWCFVTKDFNNFSVYFQLTFLELSFLRWYITRWQFDLVIWLQITDE